MYSMCAVHGVGLAAEKKIMRNSHKILCKHIQKLKKKNMMDSAVKQSKKNYFNDNF